MRLRCKGSRESSPLLPAYTKSSLTLKGFLHGRGQHEKRNLLISCGWNIFKMKKLHQDQRQLKMEMRSLDACMYINIGRAASSVPASSTNQQFSAESEVCSLGGSQLAN